MIIERADELMDQDPHFGPDNWDRQDNIVAWLYKLRTAIAEYDAATEARIAALEARIAALEAQVAALQA